MRFKVRSSARRHTYLFRRLLPAFVLSVTSLSCAKSQEYLSGIEWQQPAIVDPGESDDSPPSDAIVLFDGTDASAFTNGENWDVSDGVLTVGKGAITTKQEFGDCQVHLEWSAPTPAKGSGQKRGNSGLFLMGIYEIQILDSYNNETYFDGQAGAIYKQTPPMANANRPPGQWNTYDVLWTAPRFDDDGSLVSPAYMTAIHNGVVVLNHFELQGDTPYTRPPQYNAHGTTGPISLQDHNDPVRFRNIWVRELSPPIGRRTMPPSRRAGDKIVPIEPKDLATESKPDRVDQSSVKPIGEIIEVADGFEFTEGPTADADGGFYFTDIKNNAIHHIDAAGNLTQFTGQSNRANGLSFKDGQLFACEMDGQLVVYDVKSKQRQVLADKFEGNRFNACNDLVRDEHGGIYFTDPMYNAPTPLPQTVQAVYYLASDGEVTRVTGDLPAPNGITLSIDGSRLYVAPTKQSEMMVYEVQSPGKLSQGQVFCQITQLGSAAGRGSDGITIDVQGKLYFTTDRGIEIVSPEGKSLHTIELPLQPANVTFTGEDRKTLVATSRTKVFSIKMPIAGAKDR